MSQSFGPYSPLRDAHGTWYVSGQVGLHPESKQAPRDITAQTERALLNLEAVLRTEDLTIDDVVKTTVYLVDIGDFAAMNAVYEQRFAAPRPARTTIAVKELPRLAGDTILLVEIDAVAVRGSAP